MGDNRPPRPRLHELAKDDFNEAIDKHPDDIRGRIADLADSASRAHCIDDESAGRCTELLRQIAAVEKVVDREREQTKAPYREGERIIDDTARAMLAMLLERRASVQTMHRDYVRKKQDAADQAKREAAERQRAQINERRAAQGREEIAASAMPAKAVQAEPVRIQSEFGGIATASRRDVAIIVDWDAAYARVGSNPKVREAIQKVIDRLVRAGERDIPGVELADDIDVRVR